MPAIRSGLSWAGLVAGPAAWAVSFQLNYSISHWQCMSGAHPAPIASALALVIAGFGAYMSWCALSTREHGVGPPMSARARRFVAGASLGIGAVFAFAILLQLAAGLIFGGCEL